MQNSKFERGVWVVAYSAGKSYVGRVATATDFSTDHESIAKAEVLQLEEAIELSIVLIMGRTPVGTPMPMHHVSMNPVGLNDAPSNIWVRPNAVQFFAQMPEAVKKRHTDDYNGLLESLRKARLSNESGVILPQ
jgi:hypothetical protein